MTQWTALAVTLLIEIPIVVAWVRLRRDSLPPGWGALVAVAAAATLLTHPVVWYFDTVVLASSPFPMRAAIVETFAVVAEAVVFWRFLELSPRVAFAVSLTANMASFGTGIVIWALR